MKILDRSEVGEVIARIYDSELDFRLETEWDAGYYFFIGNAYDRYLGQKFYNPDSHKIEDVMTEVGFRLSEQYPNSDFAKYWTQKVMQHLSPAYDWNRDVPADLEQQPAVALPDESNVQETLKTVVGKGKEKIGLETPGVQEPS
jgi:hypothetical protein